jgi:TolA-binding protein
VISFVGCAYFNSFYNARKNYREADKQREESPTQQVNTQKYNQAIESAGRLLNDYPNSKWVDDALLLMGKSYYHLNQHNRAIRKFDELIANHPDSPLIPECKYWRAMTSLELGNTEEAIEQLRSLLGMEIPLELKTDIRFALADLLFEQESYDKARVEYKSIVEKSKKREIKARAQYRLAESLQDAGWDSLAAKAYLDVLKYKPDRTMEFDAQFNYGIVLKELQRYQEAQDIFETLLNKEIYFAHFPDVELELADLMYRTGQKEEARAKYDRLIEVHEHSEVSAHAYYKLGLIVLKDDRDVELAREYFGKVQTEFNQSEYVEPAYIEMNILDNYLEIVNSRKAVAQQLVSLEEILSSQRNKDNPTVEGDSLETNEGETDSLEVPQESQGADTVQIKERIEESYDDLDAHDLQLAEFYFYDLGDMDSTLNYLTFLIKPDVADSIRAKSLILMAAIQGDSLGSKTMADSLYRVIITDFANTDFENYGLVKLGLAQKMTPRDSLIRRYDEADSLLWTARDTLRALSLFRELAQVDTSENLSLQSQFAVGWIYEHMIGDLDSARTAYQRLVDRFPTTELVQGVKRRIEIAAAAAAEGDSLSTLPTSPDSTQVTPLEKELLEEPSPVEEEQVIEELDTKRRVLKR